MRTLPSPPLAPDDDDLECVIFDPPARRAGFYSHGFRTFYVASDGAAYLVRTPGQRATRPNDWRGRMSARIPTSSIGKLCGPN